MKSYYLFFGCLLMFGFGNIQAQQKQIYNNQIILQGIKCEQKGTQLYFAMNVNAGRVDISSRKVLVLTPIIKSADKEKKLSPIVISGKNRYKADRRKKYYKGETAYKNPYAVVKEGSDSSLNINYNETIVYEPWMDSALVEIKEEIYGCATCKKFEYRDTIAVVEPEYIEPEKPQGTFVITYVQPPVEIVKNRNMAGKAYLDFPVGESAILTDFRNNFKELSKINQAINFLKNDPNAIINVISLEGYASPDGSYKINERLSEERSYALKNYLQKEYNYPDNMFLVNSVAEDWNGLKKLVESSNLPEKQDVLNIIDNDKSYDSKKQSLKKLKGGTVYKILLDDYFPQLRRVDYKLDYTIRAFSVEEGREIIKIKPGQLSLNEMFLVANTYPKGSPEFNQVFDIAVRMFPTDTVANMNAAAIVLEKGDLAAAHRYLDAYQQVPLSWNNQGVMYMIEGDYEKAKDFLTKAQMQGIREAKQNLDLLEKLQIYEIEKEAYDAAIKR